MEYASIVLKGNVIFDGLGQQPFAGGIAVKGNRIIAVEKENHIEKYIGPDTEVREYPDQLIMPGFNDSHAHITYGSFLEDENFCFKVLDARSKEEAVRMAKDYADTHPDNEWIFGTHMNNLLWKDQTLPNRYDIDAVIRDRPVILQLADFHTLIANSMAIEKARVTEETLDPIDGILEKDKNGKLTGRFYDGGCFFFTEPVYSPSDEVTIDVYNRFFEKMKKLGLTSVALLGPYGVTKDPVPFYEKMEKEGTLTTRVMMYPMLPEYKKETYDALLEKHHDGKLRVCGLKQIVDGVTSVYTAYLLEPYTNKPDTCGATSIDLDVLHGQMMNAIKDGRAIRLHTIGDHAIRVALDFYKEAQDKYGKQGLRHVQEHIENVNPADMSRFADIGVCCAMQPMHMLFDLEGGDKGNGLYGDKEDAIGKERAKHAWPMRELLDSGAVVSLGTDFPIVEIDPLHEIYGAVTRQTFEGKPEGGWFPEQRLTMAEALRAYTWGSAYTEGCEKDFGSLEKGMLADIIVLDKNLFEIDPKEILNTEVILNVFDGQIIYEKSE